ncbi:hypothetical protein L873DRAFT_1816761, partial [Choiromyces venosus 120613-1]
MPTTDIFVFSFSHPLYCIVRYLTGLGFNVDVAIIWVSLFTFFSLFLRRFRLV